MFTLVASISCSVAVSVLLKIARSRQIDVAQAIAFNYVMAVTLTVLLLDPDPQGFIHNPTTPYWVVIALGLLLPSIFLVMAKAVKHAGIVLSDAAQRLSLIIPLIAAVLIFGESLQGFKLLGILLGLAALWCLTLGSKQVDSSPHPHAMHWLLGVWVGYGVIDVLFKQLAKSGAAFSSSLLITFSLAGVLLFIWLLSQKVTWRLRNLYAGLLLGLLNFGNIYFYIRAHQQFPDNPTLVFSAMNIGVISVGTVIGAIAFKEKLSRSSLLGIGLAICAIIALVPR